MIGYGFHTEDIKNNMPTKLLKRRNVSVSRRALPSGISGEDSHFAYAMFFKVMPGSEQVLGD